MVRIPSILSAAPLMACKGLALAGLLGLAEGRAEPRNPPPPAGQDGREISREAGPDHSRKRVEAVVRDVYEELGRGDLPGILENFDPNAKWILHGPAGIPFAGTHVGAAGIQAFFESFGRNARVDQFETRSFIVEKNRVVVLGYEEVMARPTGKSWKAHWAHVFTLQRGKIVLVEEIVDTAPILAAFQP